MGFELPDGKTARNIQDQVKFLTEKIKDLYSAFNQLGLKKTEIVEELPEVGNDSTLYLLLKDDPETGNYYEEYLWIDGQWELIGTTEIDLSGYVTLDTAQTITGEKTFSGINTKFTDGTFTWKIQMNSTYHEMTFINPYNNIALRIPQDNSGIKIGQSALPSANSSYDLGDSSYIWKRVYCDEVKTNYIGKVGNTLYFNGGSFVPETSGVNLLGNASHTWKDLHLSGYVNFYSSNSSTWSITNTSALYFARAGVNAIGFYSSALHFFSYDLYLEGTSKLTDGTNTVTVAEIGKVKTVNNVSPDASGNIAVATGTGLYLHTLTFTTGPANPIYLINNEASAYTTRALLAAAMAGSNCCCKLSTGQSIIQVDDTITKTTLYYLNGSLGITSVDITNSDTFTDTVTPYQQ